MINSPLPDAHSGYSQSRERGERVQMLGLIAAEGKGEGDRVLSGLAQALAAEGLRVIGVVQENTAPSDGRRCDMYLRILDSCDRVQISQSLGPLSQGCRLCPDGLERAAGQVAAALARGADVLIVNKFGKQEAQGGGFRQIIGQALAEGIPVLTQVQPGNRPAFDAFAEGLAEAVPSDLPAVMAWLAALGPKDAHVPAIGAASQQ